MANREIVPILPIFDINSMWYIPRESLLSFPDLDYKSLHYFVASFCSIFEGRDSYARPVGSGAMQQSMITESFGADNKFPATLVILAGVSKLDDDVALSLAHGMLNLLSDSPTPEAIVQSVIVARALVRFCVDNRVGYKFILKTSAEIIQEEFPRLEWGTVDHAGWMKKISVAIMSDYFLPKILPSNAVREYTAVETNMVTPFVLMVLALQLSHHPVKASGHRGSYHWQTLCAKSRIVGHEYLSLLFETDILDLTEDVGHEIVALVTRVLGVAPTVHAVFDVYLLTAMLTSYLANTNQAAEFNMLGKLSVYTGLEFDGNNNKFFVRRTPGKLCLAGMFPSDMIPGCCEGSERCPHVTPMREVVAYLAVTPDDVLYEAAEDVRVQIVGLIDE